MLASSAVDRGFEPRLGQTTDYKIVIYCFSAKHAALRRQKKRLFGSESEYIPVNPPPLHGSLPRKSLISRMDWVSCTGDINLPHDLPPTKKPKYNKILTYILQSIVLEIPHLEPLRWWKTPRDTNGKGV